MECLLERDEMTKNKILSVVTIGVCALYLIWRLFFTLPFDYGIVALIGGILLFVSEFASMTEGLINLKCTGFHKKPEKPVIEDDDYCDVDVLIATHSEDCSLLAKTVNGCLHMKYPDPKRVHIYLCDDGNRPEVRTLAEDMGVGCFQLEKNTEAKAGNLNNALKQTHSPLVVTFDADMIPRAEFLMETVPYFHLPKMIQENGIWRKRTEEEIDPDFKMGFVQTPQNFYNPDLFQFNFACEQAIPNEQDYFFKEINVGRNMTNSPIYAGSNTMITRECLEEVGYIHTNNITEDFATGIDIQAHGYRCYATDEVLASGLAPNDFEQLIQQRQRWGRGCVQTIMSKTFWTSNLPFWTKMSYLNCLSYWWTFARRAVFILAPILFSLFGLVLLKTTLLELLLIWCPAYLMFNTAVKRISGKIRVNRWSNIVDTILFPYLILPILAETLGLSLRKFAVTDKSANFKRTSSLYLAVPHIFLLVATVLGVIVTVLEMLATRSIGSIFVLFWLLVNGYYLMMAVLFMSGRINFQDSQHYTTPIQVRFTSPLGVCESVTEEIYESGFAFTLHSSESLKEKDTFKFAFTDETFSTWTEAYIESLEQKENKWFIRARLSHPEHVNFEYLQLIYGHKPTLAESVSTNAVDEILLYLDMKFDLNLKERIAQHENRHAANKRQNEVNRVPRWLPHGLASTYRSFL